MRIKQNKSKQKLEGFEKSGVNEINCHTYNEELLKHITAHIKSLRAKNQV